MEADPITEIMMRVVATISIVMVIEIGIEKVKGITTTEGMVASEIGMIGIVVMVAAAKVVVVVHLAASTGVVTDASGLIER